MSELGGIYAIWEREVKVFFREKSRIVSSIISPLFWLVIFGTGLGASVSIKGSNYQTFLFPGVIVMTCLFTSMFYGVYIIWDKKLDFLKGVMVAPLRRSTIFAGKVAGGMSDAILQATILMLFAPIFGVAFSWNIALIYIFLLAMVFGTVSMGLFFGSIIESPEAFGLINSVVNFPLFFLSGALFPIDNLPSWLSFFTKINPITYGVDAIRQLMLGNGAFSLITDFIVLAIFGIIMFLVGTYAFKKMKI
jgi:ABC-2 type transport system permease protein